MRATVNLNSETIIPLTIHPGHTASPDLAVPADEVRLELERILSSPTFRASNGLSRFLRFVVEQTLDGNAAHLRESTVGAEVFRRGKAFDPRLDAIVRVDARRLRARLAEYYATTGQFDPVLIDIRKGTYVPVFQPLPASDTDRLLAVQAAGRPVNGRPHTVRAAFTDSNTNCSSIAVLPFISFSSDPDNQYFSDGLTEEIISALTRIPILRVIGRSTSFRYAGKAHDVAKIGEELHVEAVLEGSVRKAGDRLRISAQLIDVGTSFHIWSRTFDSDMGDVFAVQCEISQAIAGMVKSHIPARPPVQGKSRPRNPAAYDLYLRAIVCGSKRTASAMAQSVQFLQQALALDPECAPMHARLSDLLALQAIFGFESTAAVMPAAREAADAAIGLDEHLAEAIAARALISACYERDMVTSEALFLRAIRINPGIPDIHHRFAVYCLVPSGRFDEAIAEMNKARDLDPLSLVLSSAVIGVMNWSRRFDEAIAAALGILEHDPDHALAHTFIVAPLIHKGMLAEALKHAEAAVRLSSRSPLSLRQLGAVYARTNRTDEALALIRELEALASVPAALIADIYTALEDNANAFIWFERARTAGSLRLIFTRVAPSNDELRRDPRFAVLMKKIGLPMPAAED